METIAPFTSWTGRLSSRTLHAMTDSESSFVPKHIGLTGNIASGKSTVAALLRDKGAEIIDADLLAREAVAPGTAGFDAVVERFGKEVVAADGSLDREALRNRVFASESDRDALNAIIHPIVGKLRMKQFRRARKRGAPVIVSDIPLLYEVGLAHLFDGVILVHASEQTRLDRLENIRGLDEETAKAMMDSQLPSEEKRSSATWVIDNDGALDQLALQVDDLWNQLTRP